MHRRGIIGIAAAFWGVSSAANGQCESQWIVEQSIVGNSGGSVEVLHTWDPDGPGPMGTAIVAGGSFGTVDGVTGTPRLAYFDGADWYRVGTVSVGDVFIREISVDQDNALIVGGAFTTFAGVPANNIVRWNGSTWSALGGGLTGGDVFAIDVLPDGDIVAAGSFTAAGGAPAAGIARWNGQVWSPMATTITRGGSGIPVISEILVLPDGDLAAGGTFLTIDGVGVNHLALWSSGTWSSVGGGVTHLGVFLNSSNVADIVRAPNGDLYICGFFEQVGTLLPGGPFAARSIASWDGEFWSSYPGLGASQSLDTVRILADGRLVTGQFVTTINGEQYAGFAEWTGTEWIPMDEVYNGNSLRAASEFPSGEFLLGTNSGIGVTIDGQNTPLGKIARWTPDGIPWFARNPLDANHLPGETAMFSATPARGYDTLTGTSAFAFEWQWRDTPGSGSWSTLSDGIVPGLGNTSGTGTSTLQVTNLAAGAHVELRCRVDNGCGTATSSAAILAVDALPCPADTNNDGLLTPADFSAWVAAFNSGTPECDQNADGLCTPADFSAWVANFNAGCP